MITELIGDILDVPNYYQIAHCISGDFSLGAGLAKKLNEKFDISFRLFLEQNIADGQRYNPDHIGKAFHTGQVYNLVTKGNLWDKPTYEALKSALTEVRVDMEKNGLKNLALPHLGTGHDKMKWTEVKKIIHEVFDDSDINVEIYDYAEAK